MNDGCAEPGCYEDQVTYSHDMDQIESIISWSTEVSFQTDSLHNLSVIIFGKKQGFSSMCISLKTIQSVNNRSF